MAFRLKTPEEIEDIAHSGERVWDVLQLACEAARPGVTGLDLDELVRTELARRDLVSSVLGLAHPDSGNPFPAACSISTHDIACQGIPDGTPFAHGDFVRIDIAASLNGWHADAATTVIVTANEDLRRADLPLRAAMELSDADQEVRLDMHGAEQARSVMNSLIYQLNYCKHWSMAVNLGIEDACDFGFEFLAGFGGHGIGRSLHEQPQVRFDTERDSAHDFRLIPGVVFTVEPILIRAPNRGADAIPVERPGEWAVRAEYPGYRGEAPKPAHEIYCEERTVAITESGVRVLTGPDPVRPGT